MMKENAHVVAAKGGRAIVKTLRSEACGSCGAQSACHAMGGSKEMEVEVINPVGAKAGDKVELELPESSFVKASAVTYLIPLTFLMTGAIVGYYLSGVFGWSQDASSALLALAGVAAAFPVVAKLNRNLSGKTAFIPRITRVIPPGGEVGVKKPETASC